MKRSARMGLKDWLAFFQQHRQKKIFSFRHLELFSRLGRHTLRMALTRLTDKGILKRISRGFYANPFNLPTLEEISAEIYRPSYISMESALSRSGVLSQIPYVLTCVTTRNSRTFLTSFGSIEYHAIQKKFFFGTRRQNDCLVAEPEKALLDFIYFYKKSELESLMSDWRLTTLDHKKIKTYAKQMNISWPIKKSIRIAA